MVLVQSFLKVFWKELDQFIVRSINYGFQNGELSITQKEGIITCIPKDNKPRKFLTNYRPISLLNTVYKIQSGAIANIIKPTLQKNYPYRSNRVYLWAIFWRKHKTYIRYFALYRRTKNTRFTFINRF